MHKIVIIGGGASGTILTLHLLKNAESPLKIIILEKTNEPGRGVAYAPTSGDYLLNVPCSKMGAWANQVDDFYNWLLHNGYQFKGLDFVPRKIYGNYLCQLLQNAIKNHPQHQVKIIRDEAIDLQKNKDSWKVFLDSGDILSANEVVLAWGNFAPKPLPKVNENVLNNPWDNDFWQQLESHETITLLGTGLTSIDFINELYRRKHQGKIIMMSRNGNLPLPHEEPCMQGLLNDYFQASDSLTEVLRKVNSIKRHPFLKIVRPVCVIEQLRNLFPRMWYHWSVEERQVFYKKIYPIWNINRHRIPPEIEAIVFKMMNKKSVSILNGSINDLELEGNKIKVTYSHKKNQGILLTDYLLNCTGPECDYSQIEVPLVKNLLKQSLIQCDELKTGILSNSKMQIKNDQGIEKHLWAIGPPLKSMYFESTAIHEVRNQAEALSKFILEGVKKSEKELA